MDHVFSPSGSREGPLTSFPSTRRALLDRGTKRYLLPQIDRLGIEIKARGLQQLYDSYSSAITGADDETARKLERASERWLQEMLATDPKKRAFEKSQGGTREVRVDDSLTKDNRLARALLAEFASQRVKRVPPALTVAARIYTDLLVPAYQAIVGQSSWDLTSPEFNASLGRLPDPLAVLGDWVTRNLPGGRPDSNNISPLVLAKRGGADGPPGWTLLGPRDTALGGRVRVLANPAMNRVTNERTAARVS